MGIISVTETTLEESTMVYFKSCPRCKGDIAVRSDWFGDYISCLQCGWSRETSADPLSRLGENRQAQAGAVAVKRAS